MITSISIVFRPSQRHDREGRLSYRVIHGRKVRQIKTHYKVFASEWDEKAQRVIDSVRMAERSRYLGIIKRHLSWDMRRLRSIVSRFNQMGLVFTVDDLVCEFYKLTADCSLSRVVNLIVRQHEQLGQMRTAETYTTTLNSFMRFTQGNDIPLDGFDNTLVLLYESWLRSTGVTSNTSSFYLRKLRAVYNHGVEWGVTEQRYPFKRAYTGKDKTKKRAVSLSMIRTIRSLDLTHKPSLEFARDMFMFSFYTRGMSFIDMSFLTKDNLNGDFLVYRRHKTGQQLTIKVEACLRELIDKFASDSSQYLLPIICDSGMDNKRQQYKQQQYRVNYGLKQMSKLYGFQPAVTMYVARHSWASIAKGKNIPTATISQGLGHDSERTTLIYLASLEDSVVDLANKHILDDLGG